MSIDKKQEKFEKLAERRVTEAIHRIRIIGNLSNTVNYHFREAHVEQIIGALRGELEELERRFKEHSPKEDSQFKFTGFND